MKKVFFLYILIAYSFEVTSSTNCSEYIYIGEPHENITIKRNDERGPSIFQYKLEDEKPFGYLKILSGICLTGSGNAELKIQDKNNYEVIYDGNFKRTDGKYTIDATLLEKYSEADVTKDLNLDISIHFDKSEVNSKCAMWGKCTSSELSCKYHNSSPKGNKCIARLGMYFS